jgi:glycosyltransferase involved in cell wall biosynthesis
MKSVQVSVIVPSYNAELYIGRCIRSLLKQSLSQEDFEIIVINDSSKDNTKNALLPFVGDIVLIENKRNLGLPSSLNKGIKKARGQFIVRVDSDDYVHVDFLKILSLHLQLNHSIDAIASDYLLVNNDQDVIKEMNCLKDPIGCGIMFRLKHLIELGLYNTKFLRREDEELMNRFKIKYNISRVAIPLYRYRRHENNITNDKKTMKKFKKKLNLRKK